MATENNTQDSSTSETEGQESQDQQQSSTSETEENGSSQQVSIDDSTRLPETHPLVKTLAKQKQDLANAKQALAEANANSSKATQLEEELKSRPTKEALDTLQTRYDRLEAFLEASNSPLARALDSRTFTKRLFESQDKVEDIFADWSRLNPSATSEALGGGKAGDTTKKVNPNDLIRAAFNGGN